MSPRPPADGDLLYGALLGLWTAVVVAFGLWALHSPLPELLPEGRLPERIVTVWTKPPLDAPQADTELPRPERPVSDRPGGRPGLGPALPTAPPRDVAGRARAREAIDAWLIWQGFAGGWQDLAPESDWDDAVAQVEGWAGPTGPDATRGPTDSAGSGDWSVGSVRRLGGGEVAIVAPRYAAPRDRPVEDPLVHTRPRALVAPDGRVVPVETPPTALTRDVLRSRRRDVQDCRARASRSEPRVDGRVTLRVGVLSGRVVAVEIDEDTTGSTSLAGCLKRRARFWRFPESTSGTVPVPLAFSGN